MTTPTSNPQATAASPRPADSLSWKLTLMLDEQSVDWQRGARTPVETYTWHARPNWGTIRRPSST